MHLLDTNVVSEAFRPRMHPAVKSWFDRTDRNGLFLSSITKAELLYGLAIMPSGRRKVQLAGVIWRFLAQEMRTEVLAFGSQEAEHYAEIAAQRRVSGRPIIQSDAQIAAIARVRKFSVVTRKVRDFEGCGIDIVNPWESAA
jgi:toxin FitB